MPQHIELLGDDQTYRAMQKKDQIAKEAREQRGAQLVVRPIWITG